MDNLWFSFDYGSVHFVSLNSESSFPESPSGPGTHLNATDFGGSVYAQMEWLQQDLAKASANRDMTPWIVVSLHRPFYGSGANSVCDSCRIAFENIINEFGVDFVFAGHAHSVITYIFIHC